MRLSQLLFIGFLLFALPACDGAAGADGATGPAGSDGVDGEGGADGASGADGADGLPTSKADLYVVLESAIALEGFTVVDALCLDNNDVLLSGGCNTANEGGFFFDNYPRDADNEDAPARWRCGLQHSDDREYAVRASAVCIVIE